MNTKRAFLLTGLLLLSAGIQAQRKWTLQACLDYAYQHNISLEKARLSNEVLKVDKKAAVGAFLPDLSARASNVYSFGKPVNQQTNRRSGDVQNVQLSLGTSVTLFNGLKNRNSLQQANLNSRGGQLDVEVAKNDLSLSVLNAYLQILLSKALVKVDRLQLKIDRDQLKRVKKRVRAGAAPQGEVYDMQSTLAADTQKLTQSKNDYDINRLKLAQRLQLEHYADFYVADVSISIPAEALSTYDPDQAYQHALASRPEVGSNRLRIESAKKGVAIAKADYMPTLSGSFGLSSNYSKLLGKENPNSLGITTGSNDFFSSLADNKTYSGGLSLSVPLFNRLQVKRRVETARIKVMQARLDLQQTQNQLHRDMQQAYAYAKTAYSAYLAAKKTKRAAQNSFDYTLKRFAVGAVNSFDFNQAKDRLSKAKADVLRSKYDCFFKLKVLDFYAGKPLNLE